MEKKKNRKPKIVPVSGKNERTDDLNFNSDVRITLELEFVS